MQKFIHTLLLVVLLGGLLSCENEIPFNGTESKPLLTLNCFLISDSAVKVSLSSSRFFLDKQDVFKPVTNAAVLLWVNNQLTDTLTHQMNGYYLSTYHPVPGDKIKLTASADGFATVSAEDEICTRNLQFEVDTLSEVKSVTPLTYEVHNWETGQYETKQIGNNINYRYRFKIRFSDPGGVENYYRLVIKRTNVYMSGFTDENYVNDFDDIVFGSNNENLNGDEDENSSDYNFYGIFSDELIDGKNYYIKYEFEQSLYKYFDSTQNNIQSHSITIDLQPISKSYYRFLKSLQSLDQADNFMSEPVQVYTNVNGGVGILGAVTSQKKVIVLP